MDIALQDATSRNIQAQTAILLLRDSAGATALEIQASLIGLYKSVNMHETVNFYKAISLTNTASSLTNQLYVGTGNKLQWGGQEVPDLPTTLGLIASLVTAGAGLTQISNGTTGQVELSLNQSFAYSQLNFNGSSNTLRNVTQNSVDTLVWGSDNLATQPWVTSGLATKQSVVTGLSYGAVNLAPNAPVNAIRANSGYLSIGGGVAWPQLLFDFAPSSSTPHRIAGSGANFYFEIRTTQAAIDFWNTSGIALKINANSKNINAYGNLAVTGAITCVSVTQTSDERIKTDIKDAHLDVIQTCLIPSM